MVATNGHTTTEYEGIVSRVNDRGILFAGEASWRNISKFAGSVEIPPAGSRVRCTLDGSGFIRAIERLSGDTAPDTAHEPEPAQNRSTARETSIIRMNALSHATAFVVACGGTLDDIIAAAEQLEAWVTR